MGALDFLTGGSKPTRRPASAAEAYSRDLSIGLLDSRERGELSSLSRLHSRRVMGDDASRRSNVMGTAAADIQQALGGNPTSLPGAVEAALTRAKGLSRQLRMTSDNFDTLRDRERLGVAKTARARQGIGLAALTDVAGLQDGISAAKFDRANLRSELRDNRLGAFVGLGLGAIPDIRNVLKNRQTQVGGPGAGSYDTTGRNRDAA